MNTTIDKEELIAWINDLKDPSTLHVLQSIKMSQTKGDWWDDLSEAEKEGIKRGEDDIQAGRVHTSEEFWTEIIRRREKRS